MQKGISIGDASFRALLDSGSTNNFITDEAATRTNLVFLPQVGCASDRVACPGAWCATPFIIEGEHFSTDFHVLPLAGYNIGLGTRWLASL
jgi:hypothetical protein